MKASEKVTYFNEKSKINSVISILSKYDFEELIKTDHYHYSVFRKRY